MMFLTSKNYELTITQLMQHLSRSGLEVMRTFDLGSVCGNAAGTCTHHGAAPCDCRLTVLMLFGENSTTTVTINRCDGRMWLSLVNEAQQKIDTAVEASITTAVAAVNLAIEG